MTDRIAVRGIQVYAIHGVEEHEKKNRQRFVIDVEVELDLAAAGASDDLADTVDYGVLAERIQHTVSDESWNLIETVAERVSAVILEDSRVRATTVHVHKPEAPIEVPFEDVVVTVHRRR